MLFLLSSNLSNHHISFYQIKNVTITLKLYIKFCKNRNFFRCFFCLLFVVVVFVVVVVVVVFFSQTIKQQFCFKLLLKYPVQPVTFS